MSEQEKPFGVVSIVFLLMIGVANDLMEIMFDLFAATVVGLSGQAIMEPINVLVDGIVTTWFVVALRSFGGVTILQLVDDVAELFGVPGRTLCIGLGIWIANHPQSKVGQLAKWATTAENLELGSAEELGQSIPSNQGIAISQEMPQEVSAGAAINPESREVTAVRRPYGNSPDAEPQESEESAQEKERAEELALGALPTAEEEAQRTFEEAPATTDEDQGYKMAA
jgi:hypothetical protein